MTVFDPKSESMPREALHQVQLERLQALLARLRRNVRRYRETLGEMRLETLGDLSRLPLTEPKDLVSGFPYGMFALPLREVIRLHSTVGPNGMQLVLGHTRNDLIHWARLVARQLVAAGVTANDVIQICFGGGVFGESMGYLLGAELVEASVIPEDPFHIDYQLAMLQDYRATVLITTPTNALDLAELLDKRGIDPPSLHLRTVLLTRPVPADERDRLKAGLQAEVRCNFGVAEVLDPGLCVECPQGRLHVNEDHFVAEAVDGELVVTTLCREALPLLRYRTQVACDIEWTKCACGRTGAVLRPGMRLDGRLRVNEMPLYETQIAAVLSRTAAAGRRFALDILERKIIISLEVTSDIFSDTMRALVDVQREIESDFMSRLGIQSEVRFVSGQTIDRREAR